MRTILRAPTLRHAMLAMLFGTSVLGGATHWMPAFLMRTHGLDLKSAGVVVAVGNGLLLALGSLVAGVLSDRFAKGRTDRLAVSAAVIMIAGATAGLIFTLSGSLTVTLAAYFVFGFLGTAWLPAAYAFILGQAPPRMRGAVMAVCQAMAALGSGLGPFLIGGLSDALGGSIGAAIACGVAFGFWSALHFVFAARASLPEPLSAAEHPSDHTKNSGRPIPARPKS
jgi:MFS family permease